MTIIYKYKIFKIHKSTYHSIHWHIPQPYFSLGRSLPFTSFYHFVSKTCWQVGCSVTCYARPPRAKALRWLPSASLRSLTQNKYFIIIFLLFFSYNNFYTHFFCVEKYLAKIDFLENNLFLNFKNISILRNKNIFYYSKLKFY